MSFGRGFGKTNPYSHHSLSGEERAKTERTLVSLIRGILGKKTLIELRNESTVYGKLLNCDGFMNLIMEDVRFTKISGEVHYFDEMHIIAKNIRYIHIPDEIDIKSTIEKELFNISKSRQTGIRGRGKSRGRGRGGGRGVGRGGRGGTSGRGGQ